MEEKLINTRSEIYKNKRYSGKIEEGERRFFHSFRNKYIFAMVSLSWRKVKGWPEKYLLVSFGLPTKISDPRIRQSVEAYPNRWTHHVVVENQEELDDQLMEWIDMAYEFSIRK